MQQIDEVVDTVKKFVSEKGKLTVTLCAILIVLFVSAVIVGIVQCANRPQKRVTIPEVETAVSTDDMLKPAYGSLTEDYYFSRISGNKWTDEEVERWYTKPSEYEVDKLESANDALVNTITGAAP